MATKPFIAVFLSFLMFSGCFGSSEPETDSDKEEPLVLPYTIRAEWDSTSVIGEIGEISEVKILLETTGDGSYSLDSSITHPETTISSADFSISEKETSISIVLLPTYPGTYQIDVTIMPSEGDDIVMKNTIEVSVPDEGTTSIVAPQYLVVDSSMLILEGQVLHQNLETCVAQIYIIEDDSSLTSSILPLQNDGAFSYILTDLDLRTESFFVTTTVQCGEYTMSEDSRNTSILIEANNDFDGDGIPDDIDFCPDGIGESDGWASNSQSDADQDGCRDFDEDLDDDNDEFLIRMMDAFRH